MNIASAFLLGTKIKETEVPDDPWTKIAEYPNNTGSYLNKSGIAYKGKIYMTVGSERVAQGATSSVTVKVYDGTSWSDAVTLTTPSWESSSWTFDKSSMLFFVYNNKMYMVYAHFGDYGGQGPKFAWVFNGTSWQSWNVPVSNLNQVIQKNGKLYLLETGRRGAWNVSYWWNVYEYNDSDGTAALIAQNVADSQITGRQDGMPIIVNLNGVLHVVDGRDGTYSVRHGIINDDWSYTSLNSIYPSVQSIIVYKNRIHGFGTGEVWSPYVGSHRVWNSVDDTWENVGNSPYYTDHYPTALPIIYKNRLTLITAKDGNYNTAKYDNIYRYNK